MPTMCPLTYQYPQYQYLQYQYLQPVQTMPYRQPQLWYQAVGCLPQMVFAVAY